MNEQTAQTILRLTRETYERIAREFDKTRKVPWDDFNIFTPYVKEGMTVLDVGCGNGRLYRYLKNKNIAYLGIDQNQYLIAKAAQRYPDASFAKGDITQLERTPEILGKQFDCIFCISLLSHIPSNEYRRYVLASIRQYLKPTGTFCMLNWNLWRPGWKQKNVWTGNFQRVLLSTQEWTMRYAVPERAINFRDVMAWWGNSYSGSPLYYRAFTTSELKRICMAVGFRDAQSFYVLAGKRAFWWNGRNIATICRMTPIAVAAKASVERTGMRALDVASAGAIQSISYKQ